MKWNCMQNSFSYEWFRTLTRFETEAQENSEMVYLRWRNETCPTHLFGQVSMKQTLNMKSS